MMVRVRVVLVKMLTFMCARWNSSLCRDCSEELGQYCEEGFLWVSGAN